VILEEYAVADLMDFFALLSFGSQAYLEKRSFMTGRIGQRVMGENMSIWDDGLSAEGLPAPFDAEGVPRQRIDFVRDGIAKGVAWDTYYGAMGGEASTGHALPAGETYGAIPTNMFMGTGDATKAEMLASTKRGIWVSRFWYTRTVHPLNVVLTGMTRDGTFLHGAGRCACCRRELAVGASAGAYGDNLHLPGVITPAGNAMRGTRVDLDFQLTTVVACRVLECQQDYCCCAVAQYLLLAAGTVLEQRVQCGPVVHRPRGK
jgi:hypothetical protein